MVSIAGPALAALAVAQAVVPVLPRLVRRALPEEGQSKPTEGLLTPAPGAFAIWGPLFAASIAYPARRTSQSEPTDETGDVLVAAAFGLNVLWSLNAQFRQLGWVSVALIGGSSLAAATAVERAERCRPAGEPERVRAALIGPLAGWLAIAFWANVETAANLRQGRPRPARETTRAVSMLGAASALTGLAATRNRGNLPYAAAVSWGLGGILVKAARERRPAVIASAALGIGGLGAAVRVGRRSRRNG